MPASSPIRPRGARAVPIYQTTSYVFDDADHAAALFNLERAGHIYSRISNPTTAVLEERACRARRRRRRGLHRQRQAAMHLAIATLMGAGGHIVASASLYGGTHQSAHPHPAALRHHHDLRQPARSRRLPRRPSRDKTRLVFAETIGNPGLEVLDIQRWRRSRTRPACRC